MLPPSASYLCDFIDETAEQFMVAQIDNQPWSDDLKRRVQHYGYRYDYKARRVTPNSYLGPLPAWLNSVATKLVKEGIFSAKPDQVIVNEYLPGQGISPHIDCQPCFGDTIVSLSLGSTCAMEFSSLYTEQPIVRYLEPRSLIVLKNEARFEWKHGIPARKSDVIDGKRIPRGRRLSLTLRTVVLTS